MIERIFWILGSLPFIILGTLHLVYTFWTNKFSSRNTALVAEMKISYPILTRRTTMWKAWIGFNASHSSGAMYLGIINLLIAILFPSILANPALVILTLGTVIFYLWLAKTYWFRIPFTGILISLICYCVSIILMMFH
ncbi:MAG: hypothetical protein ABI761_14855 [Saprospiraceae bacterium]